MQRYSRLYTKRQPSVPEAEFVVIAVQQAEKLYGHVLNEVRQKVRMRPFVNWPLFVTSTVS